MPSQTLSHTKYTSIYREEVVRNGEFRYFDRVLNDDHFSNGYWCFHAEGQGSDGARAYRLGFRSPEAILIAELRGWGSPENVELCWVSGGEDAYQIPRQGTAKEHLRSIAEERQIMNLGNLGNEIPVYPTDPRGLLLEHRKIKSGTEWQLPRSPVATKESTAAIAPPARAAKACNDALVQNSANRTGRETNHGILNIGDSKHKGLIVKLPSRSLLNRGHTISQTLCPIFPPEQFPNSIMHDSSNSQMDSQPGSGRPTELLEDGRENDGYEEQYYLASTPSDGSSQSDDGQDVKTESSSSAGSAPETSGDDNEREEQATGSYQSLPDEHSTSSPRGQDIEGNLSPKPSTSVKPLENRFTVNNSELLHIADRTRLLDIDDPIDPDPLVSILPCMDCNGVNNHAFDCHLATINLSTPEELNALQLQDLADAVEYFDPEQWREHHNPPPPPPPEDPEVVWKEMADIVRNEQAYKEDTQLNELDLADEQLVLLFILRTTPGIRCEIILHDDEDENMDEDSDSQGIVRSDAENEDGHA